MQYLNVNKFTLYNNVWSYHKSNVSSENFKKTITGIFTTDINPPNFIKSHIKLFLNNFYKPGAIAQKLISAKLALLGSALLQIRNKLEKLCNEKLTSCNIKTVSLRQLIESRTFLPFLPKNSSYLSCYVLDMYININVATAMSPIMVKSP